MLTEQKAALFLLFFAFSIASSTAIQAKETIDVSPQILHHLEQAQIQQDYRIIGEPVVSHNLLAELYHKNNLQLLWNNPDSVKQLFDAIEASFLEGLTPNDYHLKTLLRLQQQLATGMDYPTLKANLDILLTDALIRLAYDKNFGKVDPKRIHSTWNLSSKSIDDPAPKIEAAIRNATVGKTLANLSPQFIIYEHLKKALAYYRFIKNQGGWPTIAGGPALKQGMKDRRVVTLRNRLKCTSELCSTNLTSPLFDKELKEAVLRFQRRHYLKTDGVVGRNTLARLNQTVDHKINQIRVNLERARWSLHDIPESFILVDIAGYSLTYHYQGQVIWTTEVVVGKPYHMTPSFESSIKYLVINPTWTIPRSIIGNETLPHIKADPDYLQKQNLRVLDYKGIQVDSSSITWNSYSGKTFPYLIRQDPGPHNALGRIKFMFPNKHAIYLHDTPHRELFTEDQRAFSHGCIRVSQPLTLAELILNNDGQNWDKERFMQVIASKETATVSLKTPLPVVLFYWTVNASTEDGILFKQDVYGRDKALLQELDGNFIFRDSLKNQFDNKKLQAETDISVQHITTK